MKLTSSYFAKQNPISVFKKSVLCTLIGTALLSTSAIAKNTVYQLDITAQNLSNAISQLSAVTKKNITVNGSTSNEINSVAIKGSYTLAQALEIILKNSGLTAIKQDESRYIIDARVAPANKTDAIETITVIGSYTVNEDVNTATGLGLTLQETPQTVNIVTRQSIEDQGLASLTDVINNASGISSKAYDSSRNEFSSRGFSVDNYQIDGVPVQWNGAQSAGETQSDTSIYERVEIVRGATGLLTGAGNPSASINLVRKHADYEEFTGQVNASVSRWNNYNMSLDLASALNKSGSIRGRTVIVMDKGDSYVNLYEKSKQVFYATVDADLTENTLLRLGMSYQNNDPKGSQWGGLPIFNADLTRTDFKRSDTVGANWTSWASQHKTYFANVHHTFDNDWELSVFANKNVSTADMRLLYLYNFPDPNTGLGMKAYPARYDNKRDQIDFGFKLTGQYTLLNKEHDFVIGATSTNQDFIYNGFDSATEDPVGNFFEWDGSYAEPKWLKKEINEDYSTTQKGYFAATRISLTDEFKAIFGARISSWNQKGISYGENLDFGDNDVFIPYAGLLYSVTDNHTVYTSYTEIFQPQNAQDANNKFIDPLTGINYEIGLKSTYFNDSLHTNVTYFKTKQENLAVPDPDFVPTPDRLSAYKAANGVKSHGYELEVIGQLMEWWKISANYTAFKATAEDSSGEANVVNTRFPRKILRLFNTFEYNQFTLGAGVSWEGENYTDISTPSGKVRVEQPSYALINLMARYDHNNELSFQLNVDNTLDKVYYSQIGFYSQLAYGEPRNVTLSVKYKF